MGTSDGADVATDFRLKPLLSKAAMASCSSGCGIYASLGFACSGMEAGTSQPAFVARPNHFQRRERSACKRQQVSLRSQNMDWQFSTSRSGISYKCQALNNKLDFASNSATGLALGNCASMLLASALPLSLFYPGAAYAYGIEAYGDVSTVVETGVQFIYLGGLLVLLGGGGFLVIRQIFLRRELETAAKELQERVRTGQASAMENFELGAIMLRKKLYPLARKYLEQAIKKWEDDEQDLAQVYNALGFCYFSDNKVELAIDHYEKAVKLSPGYTVAWNNLGNAYEKRKDWKNALKAYEQTLQFDPRNQAALACQKVCQEKIERFRGVPTKFDA